MAMSMLGNGLSDAKHDVDALPVREAVLSLCRRLDGPEENMLVAQGNLASSYQMLGRGDLAVSMRRDIYDGRLKLSGEEHIETIREAICVRSSTLVASKMSRH